MPLIERKETPQIPPHLQTPQQINLQVEIQGRWPICKWTCSCPSGPTFNPALPTEKERRSSTSSRR